MSLFKGPFTININGEMLPDVLDVEYNSEDNIVVIHAYPANSVQINGIMNNHRAVQVLSVIGCSNEVAPCFEAKIKHTSVKVKIVDFAVVVIELKMSVERAEFKKILVK